MLFQKKNITCQDVVVNDFVFSKVDIPKDFMEYLDGLHYANNEEDYSEDIKKKIMVVDEETKRRIKDILMTLDIDQKLRDDINTFQFGIDKYTKGDGLPLHTDKGRLNPYEILLYLPKDNEFIGRDLHIVGPDYNIKVRPIPGLVCFINAFAENTFHGVTELVSESELYVIIGGIGINSREWRDGINLKENKRYAKIS